MSRPEETIRCSALTSGSVCPAELATTEQAIHELGLAADSTNPGSRLGSAYHEYQALLSQHGEEYAHERLTTIAATYGCSLRDLAWLVRRILPSEATPTFELAEHTVSFTLENCVLRGTLDLARYFAKGAEKQGMLEVTDWKTGRSEQPQVQIHMQGLAYACLATFHVRDQGYKPQVTRLRIVDVRRAETAIYDMNPELLEEAWGRVKALAEKMQAQRALELEQREYGRSDHCEWCPGRAICPAYAKDAAAALAVVAAEPRAEGKGSRALNAERKGRLQQRIADLLAENPTGAWNAKSLAAELESGIRQAFRNYVDFFGPVDLGNGKEVRFLEIQARPEISVEMVSEAVTKACHRVLGDGENIKPVILAIGEEVVDTLENRTPRPQQQLRALKIKEV